MKLCHQVYKGDEEENLPKLSQTTKEMLYKHKKYMTERHKKSFCVLDCLVSKGSVENLPTYVVHWAHLSAQMGYRPCAQKKLQAPVKNPPPFAGTAKSLIQEITAPKHNICV